MNRALQPELLDELPAADPRAIHSRRDLRRINALMGNAHHLQQFLVGDDVRSLYKSPVTLLEIGAGDGNISFQIAKSLASHGIAGRAFLLDQQPVIHQLHQTSWSFEFIEADVFEWLESAPPMDVVIANLFLHHFSDDQLRKLFSMLPQVTPCFAACEPRRSAFAQWFARKVWLIGCNEVTVHDADISVRAGFRDREVSSLWPAAANWRLTEHRAGLFSHFFGAIRDP